MVTAKKNSNSIYDKTIKKAIKTGFLFDLSINFYENHTRDELIERGYNESQVECANKVLAHFDTSVGAKLGRCNPDLWSLRPCADCGATVDSREFSSLARYGVVLCENHTRKRDEERICTECGGRFQDPAVTDGVDVLVRHHFFFKDPKYVCDWCALTLVKGDITFIRKRGASDRDYKDLRTFIQQLGIISKGDSKFATVEEHQKLVEYVKRFEWYFDEQPGTQLGGEWRNYYVTYTGLVVAKGDKPRPEINTGPGWYIWHPKDESKLVWICRVRIFYKTSLAFIEIRFKNPMKPTLDIFSANDVKSPQELLSVWKGRGLVHRIRGKRGTPYEYKEANRFYEDAVAAYVSVFERDGKDRVRIEKVVAEMLIGRATYYDTAKRFGIPPNKIRQDAKKRYRGKVQQHVSVRSDQIQ